MLNLFLANCSTITNLGDIISHLVYWATTSRPTLIVLSPVLPSPFYSPCISQCHLFNYIYRSFSGLKPFTNKVPFYPLFWLKCYYFRLQLKKILPATLRILLSLYQLSQFVTINSSPCLSA